MGDDFYEGKVTLPLILLDKKLNDLDKKKLQLMLSAKERSKEEFLFIKDLMLSYNISDEISEYLIKMKHEALAIINDVDIQNQSKDYMIQLIDFAINRKY